MSKPKLLIFIFSLIGFLNHSTISFGQILLKTDELRININPKGEIKSIYDLVNARELLDSKETSPFMQIQVKGVWFSPEKAVFIPVSEDPYSGLLNLTFHGNIKIHVATHTFSGYMKFEIRKVTPVNVAEICLWGPFPVTCSKTVSEIIGVAMDDQLAVGIQILNVKTIGGYPINEEGSDPSRSQTAKKSTGGALLQAYSIDRSYNRNITVWGDQYPKMPVQAIPGETLEGSSIALFGCRVGEVLDRIGAIEKTENLPHPIFEGQWGKISKFPGKSYLIADYSESTIDELLDFTAKAGLRTLYHMNAWKSWGHYQLCSAFFPHGLNGFHECLVKANSRHILLGAHTLTDFINTNDPYITPVPDPRLAVTGYATLEKNISSTAKEIIVSSPEYFNNRKADWLHTMVVDKELISYDSVTLSPPYQLIGCTRGAFGTSASVHKKGAKAGKLLDHPYKVFFPNIDLMKEIALHLADQFNATGLQQLDFDGHEGCWSTGQGDYALELFAKTFYDHLDHPVLNGTSTSEPFYWHINSYCNWGEPWNGGFTESMQQYRLDNQGLLERNFLPHMLGWYLLTEKTTLPEMEWMLARSAGYNAGFAMATSLEDLRKNPETSLLLDAIREWELCRDKGIFPEDLKEKLKNPKLEFHLEKISDTTWNIYPMTRIENEGQTKTKYQKRDPMTLHLTHP
ncbi:MAG: hypothetical protein WCL00_02705 [Bacteroidota bacterium]